MEANQEQMKKNFEFFFFYPSMRSSISCLDISSTGHHAYMTHRLVPLSQVPVKIPSSRTGVNGGQSASDLQLLVIESHSDLVWLYVAVNDAAELKNVVFYKLMKANSKRKSSNLWWTQHIPPLQVQLCLWHRKCGLCRFGCNMKCLSLWY